MNVWQRSRASGLKKENDLWNRMGWTPKIEKRRRQRRMEADMKKLLVVVDMQRDFIDGSLGTAEARAIVPAVKEKILSRQAEGWDVAFTLDTHGEDYLETREGKQLPVSHCIAETDGWELCEELGDVKGRYFEKHTFGSTDLGIYAASKGYGQIELVGLCTDICVIANAFLLQAFLPEAAIQVDPSCCAGVTPESHRNALKAMEACQITVE